MENQANVRKWLAALPTNGVVVNVYCAGPNGTCEYKSLTNPEFLMIQKYVQDLESTIVSLIFKQIQLESKP